MFDFLGRPKGVAAFAAASSLAIVASISSAHAQEQQRAFNIPAQPLASALLEFSRQADIPMGVDSALVNGKRAPTVVGNFTPSEALNRLLAGSGISATAQPGGGFTLATTASPTQLGAGESDTSPSEEIVVTGTRIRGTAPASPVTTVDRNEIDRSGYSTTGEIARNLPQSFSGGQQPGLIGANGGFNFNNFSQASSVDLRGLGPGATLTLLNGHRMAYNGINNTVDISAIPLAAIDRVEIVADGTSALYGSDAVAGVVNFLLRDDYDGAETTARFGVSEHGGASEQQISQLLGAQWEGGGILVNLDHYHQDEYYTDQRRVSENASRPTTLGPDQERDTALLAGHQDIAPWLSLSVEGIYSRKSSEATETLDFTELFGFPFLQTSVNTDDVEQYGLTAALSARLSETWRAELSGTLARDGEDFTQAFTDGSPSTVFSFENELDAAEISAEGPLFSLPAGDVSLAIGAGYRAERFEGVYQTNQSGSREVEHLFTELLVPIVHSGATRLDLSLAGRYEHYSDFGDVTTPKVGVLFRLNDQLTFRTSWGESFRAPGLIQVDGTRQGVLFDSATLAVPGAPSGSSVLFLGGANLDLDPEQSTSFTIGFDYRPNWSRGLDISFNYFSLEYTDKIAQIFNNLVGVDADPTLQPFITRNPSATQVNQTIAGLNTFLDLTGVPFDPANVLSIYDGRYVNAARQEAHGVDVAIAYSFDIGNGAIDLTADATYLDLEQQNTNDSTSRQLSGRIFFPPEFKAHAGVTWSNDVASATLSAHYIRGGTDNSAEFVFGSTATNVPIDDWVTLDGQLTYRLPTSPDLERRLQLSLAIQNLLDEDPPSVGGSSTTFGLGTIGFDATNSSALGRFVSLTLRQRW